MVKCFRAYRIIKDDSKREKPLKGGEEHGYDQYFNS